MESEIIFLHELYGFELIDNSIPNCLVFRQSIGYFNLATIVCLTSDTCVESIKSKYSKIGYMCECKTYLSILDAHNDLYNSFFQIGTSKSRAASEYVTFCSKQSEKLYSDYSYIESSYNIDGVNKQSGLVDQICNYISERNNTPQLFIIEAAAGYGKTCTAFEIYNKLATTKNNIVPIYIELSKNRSAKLFKYVLLDEIDRKFHHLNSRTVEMEIKEGNVPLIIDGFDELISKSIEQIRLTQNSKFANEFFEDLESMLDTIVMLLKNKAKIILTSRKSSFFSGEKYEKWLEQYVEEFIVVRVTLNEPDISEWIGTDKVQLLQDRSIPYLDIANPVILAYLRNLPITEFDHECSDASCIIARYFEMLLSREIERQNIVIDKEEQYEIFVRLAGSMMEFDITSEQKEFIAELILETDRPKLYSVSLRYDPVDRPKVEDLALKLAGHVLLDRKYGSNDEIGFINDFIFGTLLGVFITRSSSPRIISELFMGLAISAFSVRPEDDRLFLLEQLATSLELTDEFSQFFADYKLARTTRKDYTKVQISNIVLDKNFRFNSQSKFCECIFNQCEFRNLEIPIDLFISCTFIECQFSNCSYNGSVESTSENAFYGCDGHDSWLQKYAEQSNGIAIDSENYEIKVLEQFWPKGRERTQIRCTYRTLFAGFNNSKSRQIDSAINSLRRNGYISKAGQYYYLEIDKIGEIRTILGRTIN